MTKERTPALTTEQINQAKIMARTMKVKQIAEHFKKAPSCIYEILATPADYVRKPNANKRYSDKQKSEMIEKVRSGTHTRVQITKEYGISFSLLCETLKKAGVKSTSVKSANGKIRKNTTNKFQNQSNRYSGIPDMWI